MVSSDAAFLPVTGAYPGQPAASRLPLPFKLPAYEDAGFSAEMQRGLGKLAAAAVQQVFLPKEEEGALPPLGLWPIHPRVFLTGKKLRP